MRGGRRIIVVGLDGATWDIIKPLSDKGVLPNFKRLLENGSWGYLESTVPPVTGPAWVSFSTGRNPGKHGIFDFVRVEDNHLKLHTSKDIKTTSFYYLLSKKGLRSVILSLPLSFPPAKGFKGVMVSDFLYSSPAVYPSSKQGYISRFKLIPELTKRSGEELINEIIETLKDRVNVAKSLFLEEKWDFYFVWIGETDAVSHHFWKELKGAGPLSQRALEVFTLSDSFLGWVLDNMDQNDILFLMSDHGFGDYPYVIYK